MLLRSYFYMKDAFCCEFVVMLYWMAASSVAIGGYLQTILLSQPLFICPTDHLTNCNTLHCRCPRVCEQVALGAGAFAALAAPRVLSVACRSYHQTLAKVIAMTTSSHLRCHNSDVKASGGRALLLRVQAKVRATSKYYCRANADWLVGTY
jgi:hypothetical protein